MNEADTCRTYVEPKLAAAGWDTEPHSFTEQRTFTAGRIQVLGARAWRGQGKRADYVLRYRCDVPIAVVDDPKAKAFAAFGEAAQKIERRAIKSREMYFATGCGQKPSEPPRGARRLETAARGLRPSVGLRRRIVSPKGDTRRRRWPP